MDLDTDPNGSFIIWPPGFGYVVQDYGSADADPEKIYLREVKISVIASKKIFNKLSNNFASDIRVGSLHLCIS